jgi:hypothetical protein
MSRADHDEWCTTPRRLAREEGGRAPFSSLGWQAAQQRDSAAGTPLADPPPGGPRLYSPSVIECTTPVALRGKPWAVHLVILTEMLQETPSMECR